MRCWRWLLGKEIPISLAGAARSIGWAVAARNRLTNSSNDWVPRKSRKTEWHPANLNYSVAYRLYIVYRQVFYDP